MAREKGARLPAASCSTPIDPIEHAEGCPHGETGARRCCECDDFRGSAPSSTSRPIVRAGRTPSTRTSGRTRFETYAHPFGKHRCADRHGARDEGLEPIWTTKPETASRVRGRIERHAGPRHGAQAPHGRQPGAMERPPRLTAAQASKVAKVEHHAALPYARWASS